jgi:hypothetical protein
MTQGQGLFAPSVNEKSEESNSGRVLSSTTTQPSRETRPGSSLVPEPLAPSSVRAVPSRLPVSGVPGFHRTSLLFSLKVTLRLSDINFEEVRQFLYSRASEAVSIFNLPAAPSHSSVALNFGTDSFRLRKTKDA